jgi:protein-S-isoprenylcysteine O-methyltransferase Ste14
MNEQAVSHSADHAGVRLPPPLIYVVLFGIGLALHQFVPLAFPPAALARLAALMLLGAGIVLLVSSNVLFRRAHTSLVPVRPATALVLGGPYRLTRNPMYLGLLCVYLALALWFGLGWPLLLAPIVVLAVQRLAIAKEEQYLDQKFGDAYRAYRSRVRRWI